MRKSFQDLVHQVHVENLNMGRMKNPRKEVNTGTMTEKEREVDQRSIDIGNIVKEVVVKKEIERSLLTDTEEEIAMKEITEMIENQIHTEAIADIAEVLHMNVDIDFNF